MACSTTTAAAPKPRIRPPEIVVPSALMLRPIVDPFPPLMVQLPRFSAIPGELMNSPGPPAQTSPGPVEQTGSTAGLSVVFDVTVDPQLHGPPPQSAWTSMVPAASVATMATRISSERRG